MKSIFIATLLLISFTILSEMTDGTVVKTIFGGLLVSVVVILFYGSLKSR